MALTRELFLDTTGELSGDNLGYGDIHGQRARYVIKYLMA